MLYQAVDCGLIHDFFVIIRFSAVILLFYLAIQFGRRIKESFEKRFREDLEEFEGDVIPYRKADELIVYHFLK